MSTALNSQITEPKYPHVKVKLVVHDGNAFTVLGRVTQAMRPHGLGDAEVKAFMTEDGRRLQPFAHDRDALVDVS
jgi:hypothetical protein